jgi:hypothetical protein
MSVIDLSDINQNKLGLVNRCLQAIGEAPLPQGTIPSELPLGSDAYVASSIVEDVWIEMQNMGWWFNTDYNFKLYPDQQNIISFPASVLRIDGGRYNNYIKREGLLYDRTTQSFLFDSPVEVTIIWAASFSSLPVSAYEYIASRASRKFHQKVIGSQEQAQMLLIEEQEALINLQRENTQYQDFNLIESQVSDRWANPLRGY